MLPGAAGESERRRRRRWPAGRGASGARVSSCGRRKFRTGFGVLASRPSLSSPDSGSSARPELSEGVPSSPQRRHRSLVKHSPQLHEWKSAPQVSRGRRTGRARSLPHGCPLSILAPSTSGAVSVCRERSSWFSGPTRVASPQPRSYSPGVTELAKLPGGLKFGFIPAAMPSLRVLFP